MVTINAKAKKRRCDDLRYVNAFLPYVQVKLENLQSNVPDVVAVNDLTFVYDLEKAYYSLMMAPSASKWLCFHDTDVGYVQSKTLLFGLAPAVMYFTKICRPALSFLRRIGLKVMNMIDDWLGAADAASVRQAQATMHTVLVTLGWTISAKSSDPDLVTLFLGLLIDSQAYQFIVPEAKIDRCKALILLLRQLAAQDKKIEVRDLQRLTGSCASMFLAIPCLRILTRALYGDIARALAAGAKQVNLTVSAKAELSEVLIALGRNNGAPIRDFSRPNQALYADAGESGYGLAAGDCAWFGPLPTSVIGHSSARRELEGLFLGLSQAAEAKYDFPKLVIVYMDSSCAVSNLLKGGGPVWELSETVKRIAELCKRIETTLFPIWIPRNENTEADAYSKLFNARWQLKGQVLDQLQKTLGIPIALPEYNTVRNVIKQVVAARKHAALVIPKWTSQSWWAFLTGNFECFPLDKSFFIPIPTLGDGPPWDMVVAVFRVRS
jgi:hypothetical protein